MNNTYSKPCLVFGIVFVVIGIGVFAVRLIHPGPYIAPGTGATFAGLASIALGAILLWARALKAWSWVVVGVAAAVAVPSAWFSTFGEFEEVVTLYVPAPQNAELRLWIVDRDNRPWVGMVREKALTHDLHERELTLLRNGQMQCVVPVFHDDRPTAKAIHAMKVEKYRAARIAGAMGFYPLEATESTVVLRLDPCAADPWNNQS
ncbi:MAG: hypothetical protein AAF541_11415 [Pseudomonadota bacterium]